MREARTPVFTVGTDRLTPRQVEVLRRLLAGRTYEETADDLGMAWGTVKAHLRNVYETFGVRSTVEAVVHAIATGVFTLDDVRAADAERKGARA